VFKKVLKNCTTRMFVIIQDDKKKLKFVFILSNASAPNMFTMVHFLRNQNWPFPKFCMTCCWAVTIPVRSVAAVCKVYKRSVSQCTCFCTRSVSVVSYIVHITCSVVWRSLWKLASLAAMRKYHDERSIDQQWIFSCMIQ